MSSEINIVASADDNFAIGLAGTIKSVLSTLAPQCHVVLYVLDGGIADPNKTALLQHWNDPRLKVDWVRVDRRAVSNCKVSHHVSDATYYRLLAPTLLPSSLSRFIFLDADLLIRRNLDEMWQESMDGLPCLAVQDVGAPFFDSTVVLAEDPALRRILVHPQPIPNYVELGLSPDNPYFNAGVMVVDLEQWRREDMGQKTLQVLADNAEHVLFWDQYALNVVLSGRWRALNPLWNQNAYIFQVPQWLSSPFCTEECPDYAFDPWIVHFNSLKPWQAECTHPFADEFLRHLQGSKWDTSIERVSPVALRAESTDVPEAVSLPLQRRSFRRYPRKWSNSVRKRVNRLFGRRAA
jgi:lipopolysaccharide biosynthesis glycosyltransferase